MFTSECSCILCSHFNKQTSNQKLIFFQTIKTCWHRLLNTTGLLIWESEKEDAVLFCFLTVLACWHNDCFTHSNPRVSFTFQCKNTRPPFKQKETHSREKIKMHYNLYSTICRKVIIVIIQGKISTLIKHTCQDFSVYILSSGSSPIFFTSFDIIHTYIFNELLSTLFHTCPHNTAGLCTSSAQFFI